MLAAGVVRVGRFLCQSLSITKRYFSWQISSPSRSALSPTRRHVSVTSPFAVRTEIRKFRETVAAGDKAAAEKQLRVASRALDKSVSKGVFHRNTAANKKSGMASAFNKMD